MIIHITTTSAMDKVARKLTIGGSEAHYLYGYSTKRLNTVVEWIKNKADKSRSYGYIMQCAHGNLLEPVINEYIREKYNVQDLKPMFNQKIIDEESELFGMSCSPDGIGYIDGEPVLFEYKCPFSRLLDHTGTKIKKEYALQILTSFDVLKAKGILTSENPRCIFAEGVYSFIMADEYIRDDSGNTGAIVFYNGETHDPNLFEDVEDIEEELECSKITWVDCAERLISHGKYSYVDYYLSDDTRPMYSCTDRKSTVKIEHYSTSAEMLAGILKDPTAVRGVLCWKLDDVRIVDFRRSDMCNNLSEFVASKLPSELAGFTGETTPFKHSTTLLKHKELFLRCLSVANDYYDKKTVVHNIYSKDNDPELNALLRDILSTDCT